MRDRLYRSRRDRVIGGLAAGLARNLGIDVTWVRVGWVVLAFLTQGLAILVYIALLFVVPEEPEGVDGVSGATSGAEPAPEPAGDRAADADATTASGWVTDRPTSAAPGGGVPPRSPLERWLGRGDSSRNAALVVGIVLVGAGAWLLLRRYINIDFDLGWPVVAIVLGVILVLAALRSGGRSG